MEKQGQAEPYRNRIEILSRYRKAFSQWLPEPSTNGWLMGWPAKWSDLQPLGMDKFQEWLPQHLPSLRRLNAVIKINNLQFNIEELSGESMLAKKTLDAMTYRGNRFILSLTMGRKLLSLDGLWPK